MIEGRGIKKVLLALMKEAIFEKLMEAWLKGLRRNMNWVETGEGDNNFISSEFKI